MGTLVLQRYLEKGTALGAMFLAPVPPTGTAGSAAQLALRYPAFFQALEETISGRHTAADRDLMAKIYFSADATGDDIHRFLDFVCPESERAVAEMALLPSRSPDRQHARRLSPQEVNRCASHFGRICIYFGAGCKQKCAVYL